MNVAGPAAGVQRMQKVQGSEMKVKCGTFETLKGSSSRS